MVDENRQLEEATEQLSQSSVSCGGKWGGGGGREEGGGEGGIHVGGQVNVYLCLFPQIPALTATAEENQREL